MCFNAGPCPAFCLSAIIKDEKASNGRVEYMGSVRHSNPVLCWHGALGIDFVHRFTIMNASFPDPFDTDVWNNTSLWPGSDNFKSISDELLRNLLSGILAEFDVKVSKKLHLFRITVTRVMASAGVCDMVRAQFMMAGVHGSYFMSMYSKCELRKCKCSLENGANDIYINSTSVFVFVLYSYIICKCLQISLLQICV